MQPQLKDCRAEAERRGWLVVEEYVDDDLQRLQRQDKAGLPADARPTPQR